MARLSAPLIDIYTCYAAFLRIGFTVQEISVRFDQILPNPTKEMHIIVRSQGKVFYFPTGIKIDVLRAWNQFARKLDGDMMESRLNKYWEKSRFEKNPNQMIALMQSLQKKGFKIPGL